MRKLGLRSFIPVDELIELAASSHQEKRMALLRYFTESFGAYYSTVYRPTQVTVAYLPIMDSEALMRPIDCYSDVSASTMRFSILHNDLKIHADKFGVSPHPPSQRLLTALRTNPPAREKATQVFSYLASRQHGEFLPR
jgi:hypothetical protein